jgi:hypothetical protein
MTTIPNVISPVPALLLSRTKGRVGWFKDEIAIGDGELRWTEAVIVFWNEEQKTSGTVARCNYN